MKRGDILPSPSQTNIEEKIRKQAFKEIEKETKERKKINELYKDYRKSLTGVLIDLHWLRILGQNSKVIGKSMEMMSKSLGYLVDMVLLPMMPAMIEVSKQIMWIGRAFRGLPPNART